jgi:hypothetical protein
MRIMCDEVVSNTVLADHRGLSSTRYWLRVGIQLDGPLVRPASPITRSRKVMGMTESDLDKLWNVVPVGEANAAAASKIWKRLDMYARSTVQHELSWMAEAGRIHRLSRCMPMGGEVRLYYRREIQ